MFEKELDFFINNQDELVERYDGRFLLLREETVEGDYPTMFSAYEAGVEKFGLGNFMLQRCIAGPEAYTVTIVTPGMVG